MSTRNRTKPVLSLVAIAIASLALSSTAANAALLLETDFTGTSVSGTSLNSITYSTSNGLSGPTSLTSAFNLFSTVDATGYFVPTEATTA